MNRWDMSTPGGLIECFFAPAASVKFIDEQLQSSRFYFFAFRFFFFGLKRPSRRPAGFPNIVRWRLQFFTLYWTWKKTFFFSFFFLSYIYFIRVKKDLSGILRGVLCEKVFARESFDWTKPPGGPQGPDW